MRGRKYLITLLAAIMSIGFSLTSVAAAVENEQPRAPIPPPGPAETFFLDTHDLANGEEGVATSMTLAAGKAYRVTVEGTYSIWTPGSWSGFPLCDTDFLPEPNAMYPSPAGFMDGPVGLDPQFFFSSLIIHGVCQGGSPLPSYFYANFQVCLDGACAYESPSWHHPSLGLGDYNPDHVYVYAVVGEGHPLSARRRDHLHILDNYGQLRITVQQYSPALEVHDIIYYVEDFPSGAFPATGLMEAMVNQYEKLFIKIEKEDYCGAVEIIDKQILRRINGVNPPLDARDWVSDPWRQELYDLTIDLRETLLQLAGGDCS